MDQNAVNSLLERSKPTTSDQLPKVASRLSDAWSLIDNALDGLAMRGEKDSPLVRDLREAQAQVEASRQAVFEAAP
jgi:hypothetical protein